MTFLVDGSVVIQQSDNRLLQPPSNSTVGLFADNGLPLNVRSFKMIAL
jgi:hypothetical protein